MPAKQDLEGLYVYMVLRSIRTKLVKTSDWTTSSPRTVKAREFSKLARDPPKNLAEKQMCLVGAAAATHKFVNANLQRVHRLGMAKSR